MISCNSRFGPVTEFTTEVTGALICQFGLKTDTTGIFITRPLQRRDEPQSDIWRCALKKTHKPRTRPTTFYLKPFLECILNER